MTTMFIKDPDAVLDFSIDWSEYFDVDEVLAESSWHLEPAESLAIQTEAFSSVSATITISGGIAGRLYRLTNRIRTSLGRIDDRSIVIRVDQQ